MILTHCVMRIVWTTISLMSTDRQTIAILTYSTTTVTVCTILGIVDTHSRYSLIFSIFYCISSLILFYFKQICSILSWKCLPITITSSTRTVSRLIYWSRFLSSLLTRALFCTTWWSWSLKIVSSIFLFACFLMQLFLEHKIFSCLDFFFLFSFRSFFSFHPTTTFSLFSQFYSFNK